ncbi:MAG: DUF4129 domain-containing protein [Mycobacterium sp.]
MPPVDIDRDAAREAAENELNKAIYPKASLNDLISGWIDDLIYRIVTNGSMVPGGWFTIMVLLLIAVAVAVVAVRIARKAMRTNRGGDHQLFGPAELTAGGYRELAQQCAARGDWAAAIRHRLRAVARHLEEVGMLAAIPGRTANELARDAGASLPQLTAEFMAAATAFNDVTYGGRPGTHIAYQKISDLDDHLRTNSAVPASAPTPAAASGWADPR